MSAEWILQISGWHRTFFQRVITIKIFLVGMVACPLMPPRVLEALGAGQKHLIAYIPDTPSSQLRQHPIFCGRLLYT